MNQLACGPLGSGVVNISYGHVEGANIWIAGLDAYVDPAYLRLPNRTGPPRIRPLIVIDASRRLAPHQADGKQHSNNEFHALIVQ